MRKNIFVAMIVNTVLYHRTVRSMRRSRELKKIVLILSSVSDDTEFFVLCRDAYTPTAVFV